MCSGHTLSQSARPPLLIGQYIGPDTDVQFSHVTFALRYLAVAHASHVKPRSGSNRSCRQVILSIPEHQAHLIDPTSALITTLFPGLFSVDCGSHFLFVRSCKMLSQKWFWNMPAGFIHLKKKRITPLTRRCLALKLFPNCFQLFALSVLSEWLPNPDG